MKHHLLFQGLWVSLFASAVLAQPVPGLFTAEQAVRGAKLYSVHCTNCHGSDLTSGGAPPLAGNAFLSKWGDKSLLDLSMVIGMTMPLGAWGTLSEEQYIDITAYVLEQNGHAPGSVPLLCSSTGCPDTRSGAVSQSKVAPPAGSKRAKQEPPAFLRGERGAIPNRGAGPTQQELNSASTSKVDWLYHTHDYRGTRYSPSTEITPANASRLRVACAFQLGEMSNFQTGPLVYNGRMYITGRHSTAAIDASNCELLWKHEWTPRAKDELNANRGAAIKDGYLIRGTSDGYLLALNLENGQMIWARRVANSEAGEGFTMPPLVFEDKIVIGPALSEFGISGWVGAFRLTDGEPLWRFRTFPQAGDPGANTWKNPRNIKLGGGAVWTPFSLDTETGDLFIPVGNPAPDLPAHLRPGDNLYTNSMVVLDVRTGAVRWHKQMVPNDSHDWDLTQVSPLFDASVGGRDVKLVATVGKDGLLRTFDREKKTALYETPVTTVENQSAPVTSKGVHACPGVTGGVEWNGPAYNPLTRMLYTPAVDWCGTFTASPDSDVVFTPGAMYMGGSYRHDRSKRGWISAVDAVSGEVRWKYQSSEPVLAAVTTTAGGVVFGGELTGHFLALDAKSGEVLHRFQTGGPIGGGLVSYEIGGKQHIAVTSGRPSPFWWGKQAGSPTVFILTLP